MYYNNANNNTEKTAEHITYLHEAIIAAGLKPRSGLLSKLEALCEVSYNAGVERHNAVDSNGRIPEAYLRDLQALDDEVSFMRVTLARALFKIPDVKAHFDSVYHLSAFLSSECYTIRDELRAEKATAKKTTSKAVVDNATLDYALSLVNGTVSRAKGTAESLKQAALWLAYYKDAANPMEHTVVDSALNKVYAAVRRQAKKNAEAISAKSNNVTKDAVKLAVMERIREMQANHEYAFEVLIGEA